MSSGRCCCQRGGNTAILTACYTVTCIVFSRQSATAAENPWPIFRPCIVSHVNQPRFLAENRKMRSNLLTKTFLSTNLTSFGHVWPRFLIDLTVNSVFRAGFSWLTTKSRKSTQGRKLATMKVASGQRIRGQLSRQNYTSYSVNNLW